MTESKKSHLFVQKNSKDSLFNLKKEAKINYPNKILIEIVAPSKKIEPQLLEKTDSYLQKINIQYKFSKNIINNDHPYYSSLDKFRFQDLKNALLDNSTSCVWSIRGGSGSSRLLNHLINVPIPYKKKLFIGFSDITSILLFLHQNWGWKVLHSSTLNYHAEGKLNEQIMGEVIKIINNEEVSIKLKIKPLNEKARITNQITGNIIGGNLSMLQRSIGTKWEINCEDKIVFFEEIGELPRKISEILDHLYNAGIFHNVKAILIGKITCYYTVGEKKQESKKNLEFILNDFSKKINAPVFYSFAVGHVHNNYPILIGEKVTITKTKNSDEFMYQQKIANNG